jgi:hypothetical protein
MVRSDGTGLRKLAERPSQDLLQGHIAPDDSRIAVAITSGGRPAVGIAQVQQDWFAPGKQPAPVTIDSVGNGFTPNAWSPDGTRIEGDVHLNPGRRPGVLLLSTRQIKAREDDFPPGQSWAWLPDSRRLIGWDTRRNTATVWDTETGALRDVPGIPGPSDLRLSADGRMLLINHLIVEGDVWLLTLD